MSPAPTKNKVIAVTGGARGIGYQTAKELLRRGHRVAIGDIDEKQLKIAADELGITCFTALDVTDPSSISGEMASARSWPAES